MCAICLSSRLKIQWQPRLRKLSHPPPTALVRKRKGSAGLENQRDSTTIQRMWGRGLVGPSWTNWCNSVAVCCLLIQEGQGCIFKRLNKCLYLKKFSDNKKKENEKSCCKGKRVQFIEQAITLNNANLFNINKIYWSILLWFKKNIPTYSSSNINFHVTVF